MEKNFWQKNKTLIIILIVVLVLIFWVVGKYNYFINQNEAITGQWAQVENQLQRRFDLIPNVINTVKGITKQEKDVFSQLADARTRYAGSTTVDQKATAAGQVESSLGRLLVIAENYPELKASDNFQKLQDELTDTEDKIEAARRFYNGSVRDFNIKIQVFPNNIFAGMVGAKTFELFQTDEGEKALPEVKF